MRPNPAPLALLLATACASPAPTEEEDGSLDRVMAYREARKAGDHEAARALVVENPRVWFGSREGEGNPLNLEGKGPYAEWDRHFRSEGEDLEVEVRPGEVRIVRSEMNDYFRLLERNGSWYRITYFLDQDGRIEGYLISGWEDAPPTHDRQDEFKAWARQHHPEEWEYLRPGGKLDPTGDRAPRTRALLDEWRREVGLPALP